MAKPRGYWDYDTCFEEAKKYKTRTEFHDKNSSAYQVACKNKWIEEYTWLERKHKPDGYWTYENCFNEALKYKSRGELCKKNGTVSRIAKQNGWIDDYVWLKDERFDLINGKIDCVYVYEFEETKSCYIGRTLMRLKKRRDVDHVFSEKDTVHIYAKENNISIPNPKYIEENLTIKQGRDRECFWIDEYKKLGWNVLNKAKGGSIGRLGHKFSKYTYEVCYELAKNCTSRKDFEKYNASAYHVAVKNKWIEEYTWLERKHKPNGYWTKEHCYEEAKKYSTISEFKKNNNAAYVQARKNGWIDDYDWFIRKSKQSGYWTKEHCYEEAKKYLRISDFIKNSGGAYKQANQNNWIKDYNWFLPSITKKKWNYETCKEEALKYASLSEFRKENQSAYNVANKNKWINDYDWLERKTPKK